MGTKHIQHQHPEIPLSTIKYTLKMETQCLNCVSKPCSGQPQGLTEEQCDHLYNLTMTELHIKTHNMLEEVNHAVKEQSIQNLLNEMGRCPYLEETHAQKHLEWAQTYEHFTPDDWARRPRTLV